MAGTRLANAPGEHRAQHEELAMRDVDDAHDAEDQRQAERRERQHDGGDHAFQERQEEVRAEAHDGHIVPPPSSGMGRGYAASRIGRWLSIAGRLRPSDSAGARTA